MIFIQEVVTYRPATTIGASGAPDKCATVWGLALCRLHLLAHDSREMEMLNLIPFYFLI